MALAETAKLGVELNLDDKLTPKVNAINRKLGAFSGAVNRNLGHAIDAGLSRVVRSGFGALNAGIESLKQSEIVTGQTTAVLKSTGSAAGVTADQIANLANKYEDLNATIDDKVIQSAENVLLTFTKVRKDAFEPALEAALNINQAMGGGEGGLQKTMVQLGKALNDPVKGITALTRIGVTFDAQQQKRIKHLVAHNKLYEAQQIILAELGKEFGGSFAKAGDSAAGAQARLADKVEDVQRAFASRLLPVVTKVADKISNYLAKPETIAFFEKLSGTIASIFTDENLDTAAGALQTAAGAVSTAIGAFNKLPPEIKALAVGAFAINKVTGGAVGGVAGALGKVMGAGLSKIFATNVTVIGANVSGAGGAAGAAGAAAGSGSKLGRVASTAAGVIGIGVAAEVAQQLSPSINQIGRDLHKKYLNFLPTIDDSDVSWPFGPKNTPNILGDIVGGNGILGGKPGANFERGTFKPGHTAGDANKKVTTALDKDIGRLERLQHRLHNAKESGDSRRINNLRTRIDRTNQRIDVAKGVLQATTSRTATNAGNTTSAVHSGTLTLAAAFRSIPTPLVQVFVTASTITKSVVHQNRAGPGNGSAGGNSHATGSTKGIS